MSEDKKKMCMRLDLMKVSDADDLELGDTVTIKVTGKVQMLRGPEEGYSSDYPLSTKVESKPKEKKYVYPGEVKIEVAAVSVKKQTEFDDGDEY